MSKTKTNQPSPHDLGLGGGYEEPINPNDK